MPKNVHSGRRWPVEVIAHRGASACAPENTLAAVRLAWELGADAVEIDVQLSRDGRAVVILDSTLERTGGRPEDVASLTEAELTQVDVGAWFGEKWAGERIVTLDTVMAEVPPGRRLFVELKCCSAVAAETVITALTAPLKEMAGNPEKVVLIGFDLDLMTRVKMEYTQHQAFLVASQNRSEQGNWLPSTGEIVEAAVSAQLDGVDLSNTPAVDRAAVSLIHQAELSCCIWTVSHRAEALSLIEAGVDSLTMDDPCLLDRQG